MFGLSKQRFRLSKQCITVPASWLLLVYETSENTISPPSWLICDAIIMHIRILLCRTSNHQAILFFVLSTFPSRLLSLARYPAIHFRTSLFDLSFTLLRYFNIRDERWNPIHLAFYSYQRHHFREIFMTISRFLQQRKRTHELIIRRKYSDKV